ncbi:hypothetical protein ACLBWS_18500 [Brucellaceae bacterium D45D]
MLPSVVQGLAISFSLSFPFLDVGGQQGVFLKTRHESWWQNSGVLPIYRFNEISISAIIVNIFGLMGKRRLFAEYGSIQPRIHSRSVIRRGIRTLC